MAGKSAGGHARDARTGQYVPKAEAVRRPSTTVMEHGSNNSSGTHHRDARTGEFVTEAYARSHPSTTVTERG
ncbi:MAG: hypothetical protein QOJ11_1405 [Frankiales bacterium]|jgi:hypothetical protein|nr:hypothetical protein [Frankiales bacterium]